MATLRLPYLKTYLSAQASLVWLCLLGGSLLVNGLTWAAAYAVFPFNDPTAVLHYSIDVGIDFIGQGQQIVVLPLVGTILLVFNFILGVALLRADQRASWIVWSITPLIELIMAGAFYLLWQVNL